jgi:hypothetical protein
MTGEHILQSIAGLNNPRSQILSYGFLQNLLLLHVTLLKVLKIHFSCLFSQSFAVDMDVVPKISMRAIFRWNHH